MNDSKDDTDLIQVVLTDPEKTHRKRSVLYNNEYVVATLMVFNIDDIIMDGDYNLYVDGEKIENE